MENAVEVVVETAVETVVETVVKTVVKTVVETAIEVAMETWSDVRFHVDLLVLFSSSCSGVLPHRLHSCD